MMKMRESVTKPATTCKDCGGKLGKGKKHECASEKKGTGSKPMK